MGFAEGPDYFDPATGRQRHDLPGHPGLADARRSHHVHDTTAAIDRPVHYGVNGGHLRAPPDQAGLGAPAQAIARAIATSRPRRGRDPGCRYGFRRRRARAVSAG